jgi:hypothetical protein
LVLRPRHWPFPVLLILMTQPIFFKTGIFMRGSWHMPNMDWPNHFDITTMYVEISFIKRFYWRDIRTINKMLYFSQSWPYASSSSVDKNIYKQGVLLYLKWNINKRFNCI